MTRLEKCLYCINKGYTYDPNTGIIVSHKGNILYGKDMYGYLIINTNIFKLKAHQFAWYITYKELVDCIDHIDGDKSNNKISNLRSVSRQKNCNNRLDNNKYKGYYKNQRGKFQVKIGKKYFGIFTTEEEASIQYKKIKETYV
jgi:hypothetical protein